MSRRYECIVCGRVFPEGQGIVITRAGVTLAFHSKACLAKFFRLMVERLPEKEFKRVAKELIDEYKKMRARQAKSKII
ncbi:MAG: hypothetical protein GXO09_03485 [Crenarchaeota archaeon]|nr:hypothetical protein [Thermoproteota archaeon]